MKSNCFRYLILLILLLPDVLYGQTRITVTKPLLEVSDENLIIQYDILNTKAADLFMVWIEVTDAAGNKIKALSLTGDVGQDIKGGKNKRITWNLGNDSINIDEEIFVEVKAEKIIIQEEPAKTKIPEETKTITMDEGNMDMNEISKGNMVLSTVVLPGWGQSKTNKGKPYWLIGVAGYSCLAGSIILNLNSSSVYDDYKSEMDPDVSNDLYEKANQRKNVSKYLAYSAIGIWAADIIWVLATPVKSSGSTGMHKSREFKIVPYFDAGSNMAFVSLTYKF
jgi:hypothetical protein